MTKLAAQYAKLGFNIVMITEEKDKEIMMRTRRQQREAAKSLDHAYDVVQCWSKKRLRTGALFLGWKAECERRRSKSSIGTLFTK